MKIGFSLLSFLLIISGSLSAAELSSPGSSLSSVQVAESTNPPSTSQPTESKPPSATPQSTESQYRSAAQTPAEPVPVPVPVPAALSRTETAPPIIGGTTVDQLIQDQDSLLARLSSLSRENEEISKKIDSLKQSMIEKLYPAIFGFLGILFGGLLNFYLHRSQLSYNREERKENFSFEVKQKIFEYRNKQNNEFYGPLLILLAQSKELSSQLHDQIQKFDGIRYAYRTNITESRPKKTLHVFTGGRAIPFRLIEELPHLGKYIKASLPQVAVIIEVGEQLSALIERSSGLANPNNLELSGCLGNYLAHLRALKDSYIQAKESTPSEPTRLYTAVFPRQIYDLAKKDYDDINTQISEWELQSKPAVEA